MSEEDAVDSEHYLSAASGTCTQNGKVILVYNDDASFTEALTAYVAEGKQHV